MAQKLFHPFLLEVDQHLKAYKTINYKLCSLRGEAKKQLENPQIFIGDNTNKGENSPLPRERGWGWGQMVRTKKIPPINMEGIQIQKLLS